MVLQGSESFLSCSSTDYTIRRTALGHNTSSNDLENGSPIPSSSVSYNPMYKTKGIVGPSLKHIQPSCTKLFAHYNYCMMRYRHDSEEAAAAAVKAKQCPTPPSITPASVALFMLQHGYLFPQAIGTFAISANFSVRGYASHCVRPTSSRRDLTLFTSESCSKPRVVIQTPTQQIENPGCMNYMGIKKLLTIIATAFATGKLPRPKYQRAVPSMKLCQTQTLSAMSEASENNTKPHFGVYTLTPKNAPFYTPKTKAPYWKLKGWTIWGDRVRIRYELWEAGNTAQRQYEDADKEWLKSHKTPNQPVIIVSNSLDAVRLAEATRAVALLPRDPETDLPDRLATLDDGIAIALQSGWNPRASAATVNDLSDDFVNHITARNSLTWNDENYLSDAAFSIHVRAQRHAVAIFGPETLKTINSKERQCAIIEALPKDTSQSVKVQALYGLGSLLHDLVNREKLGIARIYKLSRNKILSIPEVMSIPQQQEYLDEFWFTAFAAAAVTRLHLGVRHWSEPGEVEVGRH